jgi:hypothetical protein
MINHDLFEKLLLVFGFALIVSAVLIIAGRYDAAYVALASGIAFFATALLLVTTGDRHDTPSN